MCGALSDSFLKKRDTRGFETGRERAQIEVARGVGGLREALATIVARGAFGVGAFRDSKIHIEVSLGGLPPKGGVQRGKRRSGSRPDGAKKPTVADYGKR